jgi:hypothetical protein
LGVARLAGLLVFCAMACEWVRTMPVLVQWSGGFDN